MTKSDTQEIKIGFLSEGFGNDSKEFKESFQRLVKIIDDKLKLADSLNESQLIVIDLGVKENLERSDTQDKFINFLIGNNEQNAPEKLPYCIIFGAEQKGLEIFNSENYGKFSSIQLFTELCPEYYVYIPIPFEISEVLSVIEAVTKKGGGKRNPFRCFRTTVENIKNFAKTIAKTIKGTTGNPPKTNGPEFASYETLGKLNELTETSKSEKVVDIFKCAGKFTLPEIRKRVKREERHRRPDIELQIYDLLIASILYSRWRQEKGNFNWFLIEDNPEGKIYFNSLKLREVLAKYIKLEGYQYWIWGPDELENLKKSLEEDLIKISRGEKTQSQDDLATKPTPLSNKGVKFQGSIKEIDCILVDILLKDKKGGFYDGLDFLELFTNTYPQIPVLILSKSDESSDIKYAFERGASYYILKERTLTFPYYYYQYLDELGKLVSLIKNSDLRKNLFGNIRYWHFKKDLLWFGNKCYHIVDHSFNHTKNVWDLANQLLYPLLSKIGAKNLNEDDLLYAFCMAVWLHDIGHKGNNKYGDPHEIRVVHPLISAELILQNPSHYGVFCSEIDRRRYSNFTFTKEKSGISVIRERLAILKTTVLEKIALLCAYHQKNCPITSEDVTIAEKIPIDYYEDGSREKKVMTLKSIVGDTAFLSLAVLLRFIDGIDINKNRVGDVNEKEMRKKVIEKDLEFTFKKLKWEVDRIIYTTPIEEGKEDVFRKLFYERVRDEIQQYHYISDETLKEQKYFLYNLSHYPKMENYEWVKDHCLYLSVQEGHFNLHSSIDRVEIVHKPGYNNKIEIHYYSNRTEKELLDERRYSVKEYWEKEEKSIAAHLLGCETSKKSEEGYVIKKLTTNRELLKEWFTLDDNDIVLHTSDDKELRKRDVNKEAKL